MNAYFDTAIILKLYVQEATSPDAIRLVNDCPAPKSSPKSVTTKKRRVGVLGGRQFFGATLKILALAAQIRRK
jgi:hypothetical protein